MITNMIIQTIMIALNRSYLIFGEHITAVSPIAFRLCDVLEVVMTGCVVHIKGVVRICGSVNVSR